MAPESSTLKKGARVVVIDDLPGVSAGTAGKVGRSIGVKSVRYRVQFENGVNAMSVAESKLVSPAAWEFIKENRVTIKENGNTQVVAAAVPVAASQAPIDPTPKPSAASEAPPTKSAPVPKPEPKSETAADDPRLAALTAKSREARKDLGIDVDAEVAATEVPPEDEPDTQDEDVAETPPESTDLEPASSTGQLVDLPDGYFPTDNRIADLLASVKEG
ncbi:MAG: hypothetical protein CNE88_08280 [Acidimicrobiales bacterium MED-G01]|nr:MAG: hypothetical protein CNE88_08280 [Acidimicrobiales bacterium MED-G01]